MAKQPQVGRPAKYSEDLALVFARAMGDGIRPSQLVKQMPADHSRPSHWKAEHPAFAALMAMARYLHAEREDYKAGRYTAAEDPDRYYRARLFLQLLYSPDRRQDALETAGLIAAKCARAKDVPKAIEECVASLKVQPGNKSWLKVDRDDLEAKSPA